MVLGEAFWGVLDGVIVGGRGGYEAHGRDRKGIGSSTKGAVHVEDYPLQFHYGGIARRLAKGCEGVAFSGRR